MNTPKLFQRNRNRQQSSTSKVRTGQTPPLLSESAAAGQAESSKPLVKAEEMPTFTPSIQEQLRLISNAVPTEDSEKFAVFLSGAVLQLEADGLCFRERLYNQDKTQVLAIRVVFSPKLWTEDLTLKT